LPVIAAVSQAARAAGLRHGPVHAECRVGPAGVVVLEVAARPIGGLCARALRFDGPDVTGVSLESLLLRAALGHSLIGWRRERAAAGVLMVPIPRSGVFREVRGVEAARRVAGVSDVVVTAKPGQRVDALPEAASYLGFMFAGGADGAAVEAALRRAHATIEIAIDPAITVTRG
jgi:hypothetical protein